MPTHANEPTGPPVPKTELEEIQIQTNAVQNEVRNASVLSRTLKQTSSPNSRSSEAVL